jgi:CrcB protein
MHLFLLAALGGAIGAGARFLVNAAGARLLPPSFPWATLLINVAGSMLMGLAVVFVATRLGGSEAWRTFLATGVLGGFTTFSAFSLEVAALIERGAAGLACGYVIASVALSVLGLYLGIAAGRAVTP